MQPGWGPILVSTETEHDPLLVGFHLIKAAGEPQGHDNGDKDRNAAKTHAATARQDVADESLSLLDQAIDVWHRSIGPEGSATKRTASPAAAATIAARLLAAAPWAVRWRLAIAITALTSAFRASPLAATARLAAPLVAARVTPRAGAVVVPWHLEFGSPAGRQTIGVPDVIRHISSGHTR